MDIYLIRHGRTNCNLNNIYAGETDSSLSDEGIKQINLLKEKLKNENFDIVYVSPMKRTLETAKILGFKGVIDERIREVNFGLFEGLTFKEIEKKYPKDCKKWEDNYIDFRFPEGEGLTDVYKRTSEFIDDIPQKYNKVLVITHGGIIKCALCNVFGRADYFYKFTSENGSCSIISIENGFKYIKAVNR
jgi:alpha-ribazole phosphatase